MEVSAVDRWWGEAGGDREPVVMMKKSLEGRSIRRTTDASPTQKRCWWAA